MIIRLQPFYNAEGGEGGAATFEINGQQMTAEQVVDNYKKLQADHTKVTQKNSELSKDVEKAKPWLDFDKTLDDLTAKTGQQIKPQVGQMIDNLINGIANGKAPTDGQMGSLSKAIDKAEAKGDEATVERLQALESVAMEAQFEKAIGDIEKLAKTDGIEFDRTEFNDFTDKWLDDLGIGDDDEFDVKLLKKAYDAYEAKKLKESSKKGNIPPLGTSGGAAGPNKTSTQPEKIGGIKGAAAAAREFLSK